MPTQYQVPSAWASIAELMDKVDHVNRQLISPPVLDKLLMDLKTEMKAHVVNKVALVQSTLSSKSRGLRTFVIDVTCCLGQRLSMMEVKGSKNPPAADVQNDSSLCLNQDAEVETRLLKLETLMDGLATNTFGTNLVEGVETASLVMAQIEE
jgi:hypothetical protein